MSNFLEQPNLGIADFEYLQLLQNGQKLTRSNIMKYSKDIKGPEAQNSPTRQPPKKTKTIKGLTKTKTTKKEEKAKEDEGLGDVVQKKVKKVQTPTPSPLKRSQSNPIHTITTPKPQIQPKIKKKIEIIEEIEVIKEPPKAKLPGVILETPTYCFPFFPQYTNRYYLKNEITLGFNELTGRNIKVLQKGDEKDQLQLLNAVITKKSKNDEKFYIEYVDQKPQKYHHLKKKLKKIEELTHRDFFLCQEIGVVELNAEMLSKLLGSTDSELRYWPVLVLNNASKEFKSEQLIDPQGLKISDDFSCLDEGTDIAKAVKELLKEGINVQNIKKKTQIKVEHSPSNSSPIMVEDDNFSREVSSIFKLDDSHAEEEKIQSVSFTPNSNIDLDSFSDFGSSPLKKEQSQRIEEENEALEEEKKAEQGTNLFEEVEKERVSREENGESELEGKKEETTEEKSMKLEPAGNELKEEEFSSQKEQQADVQKHLKHSVILSNKMAVEEKKEDKESLKMESDFNKESESQLEKAIENQVLVWFVGTNVFKIIGAKEICLLSKEIRDYFLHLSKKSAYFNKIMIECNQFIRNYNRSTDSESSFAPLTESMVKDKLFKLVQIKNETEYTYYAVPLKVLHQVNQKSLILRCFDTPGKRLKQVKLGGPPHFLRSLGPLPTLNPDYLDSIEIISQDFRSPDILRVKLFPDYFTTDLIDQNINRDVLHAKEKLGTTPEKPLPLNKEDRMRKRCKKCNFIIGDHNYYVCLKCKDFYHSNENCISDMIGPNTDCQNWVCPNCKACELCYSKKILKGDNMVYCSRCDRTYHTECHTLILNRKAPIDILKTKFICENCARCSMCDEELASFGDAKVSEDGSVVCEDCFKSKMKKEYCPVCRKKWEVSAAEMIECSCQMWIHRSCDPELTKEVFNEFSTTGKVYFCPLCRKQQKNNQIIDFITILSELDELKVFEKPVDTAAIPNYKLVIEQPMDFSSMIKRAKEYYYIDASLENATYDLLLQDFNLICDNATLYNMPKSNIHVQAKKLKKLGYYAFNWFSSLIKQPSREFLKGLRKKIAGPLKIEFTKEIEEYCYDILFTEPDTNPLTKIRLVEGKKLMLNPIKKNENKEIMIEITGLNFVLNDKNKEERKGSDQMQTRKHVQADQDYLISAVKEEIIHDYSNIKHENDNHVRDLNESRKHLVPSNALKAYNKEIFNFIDELLNINPKNKPFYYFSPIFIQFSNPALLIEDICYLCGSFGDREAFIRCGSCSEVYHHYCVSKSYGSEEKLEQINALEKSWLCPKCKSCESCHKKPEFFDCLICEKCDKLFHLQCLYSNITVVFPPCWRCEDCFSCANCGGNKVINEELFGNSTNEFYPEFCEDFKYCYECGLKLAYCKFCRICKKYCQRCIKNVKGRNRNSKGEEIRGLQYIMAMEDSVECAKCNYYYHIACYQEDFGKINNIDEFTCYYCQKDDRNLEAFQQTTKLKSEELLARIKSEKALLKVCEQLFKGKKSDDFERVLPAFVCENYKQLIANQCVKDMLENFKFLDPATKILMQRDSTAEPTAEPWETILNCWSTQTHSLISRLEVELHQDLENECALKVMNASLKDVSDSHEITLKKADHHKAIETSSYLEKIHEEFRGNSRFGSNSNSLRVSGGIVENSCSRTFELLNSELWTLQAAVNTCKRENERFEFGLKVPEEGSSVKNCEYLKRYSVIQPGQLSEIRFDCTTKLLERKASQSVLVDGDPSAQSLGDIFESSEAEIVSGSLQSKEQFPFAFTQAQNNRKPTLESFKSRPNYSSYEELAKMLINEMKAIEFLRIKFYHWHSQPSVRAKFHPENVGLKFSGAIYKTPRPIFHSHSHGGATRSSQSSSNLNRTNLSLPAVIRTTTTEKKQDTMDIEQLQPDPQNHSEPQNNASPEQYIKQEQIEETKEPVAKASTSTSLANNLANAESNDTSRHKAIRSLDMMIPEINQSYDEKKDGPLDNIECICCKLQGDRTLSGRLLFVGFDQWVHANCALWSHDVYEDLEGGLINFLISYKKGVGYICQHCYMSGATITCDSKKCQAKFHFHCALQANCAFMNNKKFYCKNCSSSKNLLNRTINDFSTNRRFYVKRNHSLFTPETTKNVKYFKERSLNLSVGGYARIGGLSLLSFKRLNIETKLLFREYYAVRLVEDSLRKLREPLLILLEIAEKGYNMRFDFVDRSELTRINFLEKQLNEEMGERGSWVSVESFEKFQELMRKTLNRKDFKPQFKDFMGDFLGMYNEEIRIWLKNAYVKQGEEPTRVENSSFEKYFYAQDTEDLNPFDRSERISELYGTFTQKSSKITSTKEDPDRFKNPRERSFNIKVSAIRAGKRKGDTLAASWEVLHEQVPEGEEILIEVGTEAGKLNKIFSNELEIKLKQEYASYRKRLPKVFVAPSPIHKYGLFASENFNKNEIVIEYCGELLRNKIADRREAHYRKQGFGDCYMFRLKKDTIVDASFKGNQARYLNHSCDPSCGSSMIEIDGVFHIIVYANRAIYAGEELTYDYQFDIETEKIECMCGAKNCLGRLN